MDLNLKNPDGYLFKAAAYYNQEKFNDALVTATTGIATIPDYYLLYYFRASIYRKLNNATLADADDAKVKELASK